MFDSASPCFSSDRALGIFSAASLCGEEQSPSTDTPDRPLKTQHLLDSDRGDKDRQRIHTLDPNLPVASVFFRGSGHYLYINVISNHSSTVEWSEISTVNTS